MHKQLDKTPALKGLDYKNLVDLQAIHTETTARLDAMAADLQEQYLNLVDDVRAEYARLQGLLTETETSLEVISRAHPEWFQEKKSVKTPYGVVKFHRSTSLKVQNEELSILVILGACSDDEKATYLRLEHRLNLEALEKLTDEQLAAFRIQRITEENFSVKPAAIDLGKAVKQAEKVSEAREKEAA